MVMIQVDRDCVLCGVRAEIEETVFVIGEREIKESEEIVPHQAYNGT